MSGAALSLWVVNVLLDTGGRVLFKAAADAEGGEAGRHWRSRYRSPRLWGGIACFALEFVAWIALLSLIPLSQAVLIGSVNIITVALAGRLFFGERLYGLRVVAIALIATGVALAGVA